MLCDVVSNVRHFCPRHILRMLKVETSYGGVVHEMLQGTRKGVGYMAWKWICISLESRMVSWYKNKIVRAGVSNCVRQCLNFLVLNVHIPTYLGSRGKPFFRNSKVFLLCLPIVDQYEFVHTNLYYTSSHTLI